MASQIQGRILYVSPNRILLARGVRILGSSDGGRSWRAVINLPIGAVERTMFRSKILRRLLRKGVHHFVQGEEYAFIIANKNVYRLRNKNIIDSGPVPGSRPLCVCTVNDSLYYGEYRSNPARSGVNVWRLDGAENSWETVWKFTGVRHVHGIFHDPYEKAFWVTTGDLDKEAAIWRTDDNFTTLKKVAGGSQQFRAVQLLFTRDFVYFGSDIPDAKNYIYRMDRQKRNIEQLAAVSSSVFYGCKVGDALFFSTAVEPSQTNTTRYSEIWGSPDGNGWQLVRRFKKDFLPMKYFQYGQVLFPSGPGDGKNLWFTPTAMDSDCICFRIPIADIF